MNLSLNDMPAPLWSSKTLPKMVQVGHDFFQCLRGLTTPLPYLPYLYVIYIIYKGLIYRAAYSSLYISFCWPILPSTLAKRKKPQLKQTDKPILRLAKRWAWPTIPEKATTYA